jgi:hypothetical protein
VSSSRTILRHVRVWVVLLVAVLFFVPPLVRATLHLDRPATSSPLRLNRGFGEPETKCQVVPNDLPPRSPVFEEPSPEHVTRMSPGIDEPIPDSPLDSSPDSLRGPPLARLA